MFHICFFNSTQSINVHKNIMHQLSDDTNQAGISTSWKALIIHQQSKINNNYNVKSHSYDLTITHLRPISITHKQKFLGNWFYLCNVTFIAILTYTQPNKPDDVTARFLLWSSSHDHSFRLLRSILTM